MNCREADWNGAFNFSERPQFLSNCAKKSKGTYYWIDFYLYSRPKCVTLIQSLLVILDATLILRLVKHGSPGVFTVRFFCKCHKYSILTIFPNGTLYAKVHKILISLFSFSDLD